MVKRKHNSNIDFTTWCDESNKAGVSLANILNEVNDGELNWRINGLISKYHKKLRYLSNIEDKSHIEYFALLHHKISIDKIKNTKWHEIKKISVTEEKSKKITSHLMTMMSTIWKQFLNKYKNIKAYKPIIINVDNKTIGNIDLRIGGGDDGL